MVDESKKGFEVVKKGLVKRSKRRVIGLFIDGVGLDRAARRINKKIDISNLIQGVTSGLPPVVARYYTLIPYEDDSRHRAYLDALEKAGLTIVVKRLPPKGISRQVSFDPEMASDIVAFALGHSRFSSLSTLRDMDSNPDFTEHEDQHNGFTPAPLGLSLNRHPQRAKVSKPKAVQKNTESKTDEAENLTLDVPSENIQRVITIVCPSHDIKYPLSMAKELGVDTVSADFGKYNRGDILKSAANWIDLSDSETIWRE